MHLIDRALGAYRTVGTLRSTALRRGRSIVGLIIDFAGMRIRQNPTLGLTDYLGYRLFDKALTADSNPKDYVGWRAEGELGQILNARGAVMPGWDKITFAMFAALYQLPVPNSIAVYREGLQREAHFAEFTFGSVEALAHWMRNTDRWPLFAKPSYSQQSIGSFAIFGYDHKSDSLLGRNDARIPVSQFVGDVLCERLRGFYVPKMGYLFQELLRPHQAISDLLGSARVSSVRVVLIQDEMGVEIVSAVWKAASDENETDRFSPDNPGNMIADVDLDSGRLRLSLDEKGATVRQAPKTGNSLESFVLPDWEGVVELCQRAAKAFPLMRIQHWDVALTDRGPCLLELNDAGAIGWLQCFGHGLLTPRMKVLLRKHADPQRYPWVAKLCR